MNKHRLQTVQFTGGIFALILVVLSFQNCGRVNNEASLVTGSSSNVKVSITDIFEYPYTQAPQVYGQVQFASKDATSGFSDVIAFATLGMADGSEATFDYDLSIMNENNFPVCPKQTGRLLKGATSVITSCLSNVNSKQVQVVLKAKLIEGEKATPFEFSHIYTE